eukprot:3578063-Amphidinium_carterae.1
MSLYVIMVCDDLVFVTCGSASGIGGLLGSLLGAGGTAAPRGARAAIRHLTFVVQHDCSFHKSCLARPSGGLAAEVDGTRIDKSRGVAKAAEVTDCAYMPPYP